MKMIKDGKSVMINPKLKIFAIAGKARHGKDTVASMIKNNLESKGYKVLITHYADLLKFICKSLFDWDGKKNAYGRQLLQYVGTDVIRKQAPDYWVNYIIDMLHFFGDNWDYVMIADCRFPNEIDLLKANFENVCSIRVIRPNFDNGLSIEQQSHLSETALDKYDYDLVIYNETDLQNLEKICKEIR